MRQACSLTLYEHANVRKTCTLNTGHRARATALLTFQRRRHAARLLAKLPATAGSGSTERRRVRRARAASAPWWTWRGCTSKTRRKSEPRGSHTPARGPTRARQVSMAIIRSVKGSRVQSKLGSKAVVKGESLIKSARPAVQQLCFNPQSRCAGQCRPAAPGAIVVQSSS